MIETNINIKDILNEEKIKEEENLKQEKLKKKHNIKKDDVYIVEKKSLTGILIKTLSSLLRIIVSILFIMLASYGLMALIYKEPREEMFIILKDIIQQIINIFN